MTEYWFGNDFQKPLCWYEVANYAVDYEKIYKHIRKGKD